MSVIPLQVERRESGKSVARAMRREGLVPGVFYKNGEEGVAISVPKLDLRPIIYTRDNHIVELSIGKDGAAQKCIVRDVVFDPITDEIVHFDLFGLTEGKDVRIRVPLRFIGQSVGERGGGIATAVMSSVRIVCTPQNIPDSIKIDISEMKIGDNIRIRDLDWDGGTITEPESAVVYRVATSRRAMAGATAEGEGAEAAAEAES